MKRILLALILGLTFVGSMPAMEVTKKALLSLSEANKKTDFLLPKLIGSYALAYSLIYAHELGHKSALKLLFGNSCSSEISVSPSLSGGKGETKYTIIREKCHNLTDESIKKRLAIVDFAGPLAGLAANVLVLKLHDILIEWGRNNSGTLLQPCLTGLQKSLFNSDQSLWILIPVLLDMGYTINDLINVESDETDISHALQHLQINNPKNSYPKIAKYINHLMTTYRFFSGVPIRIGFPVGAALGCKISEFLDKK